jgi:hypothetical protein
MYAIILMLFLASLTGGKARRQETTRKSKSMWVGNIKIDLREVGRGGMDWINLAQDRDQRRAIVTTVMNLLVPLNAGKFLGSCTIDGFSRRAQFHDDDDDDDDDDP